MTPDLARLLFVYSRGTPGQWRLAILGWNLAIAGALALVDQRIA